MKKSWTREETIIVFNLYCKIPFNKVSKSHPDVIRVANLIARSPSAVGMKIGNLGSFDENLKAKNISGLKNASKLDGQIWNEFNQNWDKLAYESEILLAKFSKDDKFIAPLGDEKLVQTRQRVNQNFFRNTLLGAYNESCAISGLCNGELLVASHIKPWHKSSADEKTNPQNGILLNALFDKAFDRGFMTILPDFKVKFSGEIRDILGGGSVDRFFKAFENKSIILPDKFLPKREFLEFHNETIFEGWKRANV